MLRRSFGACAFALALATADAACAVREPGSGSGATAASPVPTALPSSSGATFLPDPPVAMRLAVRPLGVSPDGVLRWLVLAEFRDASGAPTTLVRGGDVDVSASGASAQWQTRLRFGGPSAIVSTPVDATIVVRARADVGVALPPQTLALRTHDDATPRVVARALGPHLVQIGWFPRAPGATVRVARDGRDLALVDGAASTYRDTSAEPGRSYRYAIAIPGRPRADLEADTPHEASHGKLAALGGIGAWLSFSASPYDANSFSTLDANAIVARAARAGLRSIQLRVAYGAFDEIVPDAKPAIDALLDAAAANGVAVVGWTIPRARDFDDLATAVAAARYRTSAGNGFAALAVDLERGDDYLGSGDSGFDALAHYLADLRAALGPDYPLVATVEDPALEHLDGAAYPYAAIARSADVLQPMTYWRMLSKAATTPDAVAATVRTSYATLERLAGKPVRIAVGAQTSGEGPRGAPPGPELAAAIAAARDAGAVGITFFDWTATSDEQWTAIGLAPWAASPSPRPGG
jgi:hypothetical protein